MSQEIPIFFKSSRRIKPKVKPEQLIPSNTYTNSFPLGATVILSDTNNRIPSFKIYFNLAKDIGTPTSFGCRRVVAHQIFSHTEKGYVTWFGQGSNVLMDDIPKLHKIIKEVEALITA